MCARAALELEVDGEVEELGGEEEVCEGAGEVVAELREGRGEEGRAVDLGGRGVHFPRAGGRGPETGCGRIVRLLRPFVGEVVVASGLGGGEAVAWLCGCLYPIFARDGRGHLRVAAVERSIENEDV